LSIKAECIKVDRRLVLGNEYFSLDIILEEGVNPTNLTCKKTGRVYADAGYRYRYRVWEHQGVHPRYVTHSVNPRAEEGLEVAVTGTLEDVQIDHTFFIPDDKPYLDEMITVRNTARKVLDTPCIAFGFAKMLQPAGGRVLEGFEDSRVVAVPFRREREGLYVDYSFQDLLSKQGWFRPWFRPEACVASPEFGSEGWAWTDGEASLLIAKHNLDGMEFSLLRVEEEDGKPVLRFGGAGVWHGDPEAATRIAAGGEARFGTTRYTFVQGGWRECYYAFRDFMNDNGHGVPEGFNPPIHWNELYDNPLWWGPDTPETRWKLYTLASMEEEAAKAKELGCEALYLDPGWDTMFSSSIWAAERLLPAEEFVRLMKTRYRLDVALHTPLAGWPDHFGRNPTYPEKAHKKDADGRVRLDLCMASPAYLETKTIRLLELARAGVVFMMFDGDAYMCPCYDASHGHSVPLTREEHCKAILKLAKNIHREYPKVLIELHDAFSAVYPVMPTYYLHGSPGSPDELWAYEYMWDPMWDLLSGRSIALYYYNLAYGYPLYLHIDLRKDDEHALEFWWYASTCRHLGVGGKHPNLKVWEAHKQAMQQYRRLKPFYTQGVFYGLDETIHVHTLKAQGKAVVNAFNLSDSPETKEVTFQLREIGFNPEAEVEVKGASYSQTASVVTISFSLPAKGTALIEVNTKPKAGLG